MLVEPAASAQAVQPLVRVEAGDLDHFEASSLYLALHEAQCAAAREYWRRYEQRRSEPGARFAAASSDAPTEAP